MSGLLRRAKQGAVAAPRPRLLTTPCLWIAGGGRKLRVVRDDKPRSGGINHVCRAWSQEVCPIRTIRSVLLGHMLPQTTHDTYD